MTIEPTPSNSPPWGSTTKLVVGLTIIALVAALVIQFRNIIGPLILSFILAYLLQPVAGALSRSIHVSWRAAVNLVFLILVILLGAILSATGFAIFQQVDNLVRFIQRFFEQGLPDLIANLSTAVYQFGPFRLDFRQFDLASLSNQIISTAQAVVGQVGGVVSTFAASAVITLGWSLFVLLIAYFLLADARQMPGQMLGIDLPGYNQDIRRLVLRLRQIWDIFLRGQLIITLLVVIAYMILMAILDLRFFLAIALMAGLARFVPYVGPAVTWTVTGLVAFFQGSNYFGLSPLGYVLLVVGMALLIDQVFDNVVVPRLLGSALGVHPAAVLVAAIIAANLIGLIGLVLAAPVLATLELLGSYVMRKMLDMDPWPVYEGPIEEAHLPWTESLSGLLQWWRNIRKR